MASCSAPCNQNLDPERCVSITASNATTYQISHSEKFDDLLPLNDPVAPGRPVDSVSLPPRGASAERGVSGRGRKSRRQCEAWVEANFPASPAGRTGSGETTSCASLWCSPPPLRPEPRHSKKPVRLLKEAS